MKRDPHLLALSFLCVSQCSSTPAPRELHPDCYRRARYTVADIPALIKRLSDPTPTEDIVPYVGGYYAVGDEALWGLVEVIPHLPYRSFVGEPQQSEWEAIGVGAYYKYVRADPRNRVGLQQAVRAWIQNATREQREQWGTVKWVPVDGY